MNGSAVHEERTDEGILILTINRPEAYNAINAEVNDAMVRALIRAEADRSTRAVVITGAGRKAFSTGADLKAVSRGERIISGDPELAPWGLAGTRRSIPQPVIAAVEGVAFGGGFELALAADIVVAGRSARFALPEVRVGQIAGAGGAVRLARQLPSKVAMLHLLTGEEIPAATAHGYGLVSRIADDGGALDEGLRIARAIAANAPLSVVASKAIATERADGGPASETTAWHLNDVEFPRILASRDSVEGATAFAEKRVPRWTGS